jgi:Protein of unknown function (DUF2905)
MAQFDGLGRWLIAVGLGIAGLGVLVVLLGKVPFLSQLGNLPGDVRFQTPDGRLSCWVPIVSSIVLSIVLTVLLNLVVRLLNR